MSQQNKTQLQSLINTNIADNTVGDITAADVRNSLINVTDSLLFNSGSQTFDGTLTATAFSGDGSSLTGVTGEWDGSLNGNAEITGSLIVSGSSLTAVNGIISNAALVAQSATVNSTLSVGTTLSTLGNLEVTGNSTIGGNTLITGSLTTSGSVVDFTDATAISGSTFSGSFVGDGSSLTGVTGEWDGTLNGNAEITGSLIVSGSASISGDLDITGSNINFVHPTLGTAIPTFTLSSTDGNPGFTIDSGTAIDQVDLYSSNKIYLEGGRGSATPSFLNLQGSPRLSGFALTVDGTNSLLLSSPNTTLQGTTSFALNSPTMTMGNNASSTTTINGSLKTTSNVTVTGSLTASGSVVDFTDATAISGSTFSGSFVGDGSGLTGISSDPFPYTGSAIISGSLAVTGSNIDFVSTSATATPTITISSTDGDPELTIDSQTSIDQIDIHSPKDLVLQGRRGGGTTSQISFGFAQSTFESPTINITSPSTTIGTNSSSTTTMNGIFTTEEYTVSSLPASPATGSRAHVTDSTLTTFYSPVTGSGANPVPVFYNGTQWVIA